MHAFGQAISNLINPESLHFPPQFYQALIPQPISRTELARPASVVAFAVHLNIQTAVSDNHSKVEIVLLNIVLWYCPDSHVVQGRIRLGRKELLRENKNLFCHTKCD